MDVTLLRPRASVRVSEMGGKDYTEPKGVATKILAETGCAYHCTCCCSATSGKNIPTIERHILCKLIRFSVDSVGLVV